MALKFRSEFSYQHPGKLLTYKSPIGLMGSCFTDRMGQRLYDAHFDVEKGFFGTLFNPLSIFKLMEMAVGGEDFSQDLSCQKGEDWVHYLSHSKISSDQPEHLLNKLHEERDLLKASLIKSKHFFITLGSAYAYRHKASGQVVANCHKQPASQFNKELLDLNEQVAMGKNILQRCLELNPELEFVFTVSPVKHLRDGVVENKLSKSLLRLLCQELCSMDRVHYLPVLEWVEEDLRDYRFYEQDLAHPNHQALDYIWEQLQESMFSTETKTQMQEVLSLKRKIEARGAASFSDIEQQRLKEFNTLLQRPLV